LLYVSFVWVYVNMCTVRFVLSLGIAASLRWNVQPRWIIFNEVETKDLYMVRYSSTLSKGLLFCGFEVFRDSWPSYLYRLWTGKATTMENNVLNVFTWIPTPRHWSAKMHLILTDWSVTETYKKWRHVLINDNGFLPYIQQYIFYIRNAFCL
jgi:hypothetical protein